MHQARSPTASSVLSRCWNRSTQRFGLATGSQFVLSRTKRVGKFLAKKRAKSGMVGGCGGNINRPYPFPFLFVLEADSDMLGEMWTLDRIKPEEKNSHQ